MGTTTEAPDRQRGPFDLHGRLALVTGSRRGIGRAVAEALLHAGARVVLNGPDPDRLDVAVAALRQGLGEGRSPQDVVSCAFDVTDNGAAERALAGLVAAHGYPDVLVNNAGIQLRGALTEVAVEDWRRVVEVNLTGAFVVGRTLAAGMVARGSGKIINICSVQSMLVRPTTAPYAAAKSGLAGLTRSMCAEWGPHGVPGQRPGPRVPGHRPQRRPGGRRRVHRLDRPPHTGAALGADR